MEKSSHLHPSQLLTLFTQAQTILAYFSFRQEPHLSSLFTDTKHRGISSLYFSWHTWKPGEPPNRSLWHFEPCRRPTIDPCVDLILVPSIACDVRRYRLGYGGGFMTACSVQVGVEAYDRHC